MSVKLNVFTARVPRGGTVEGPARVQACTAGSPPEQSALARHEPEARRVQDTFEAAPAKQEASPRNTGPKAPGPKGRPDATGAEPKNEAAKAQAKKGWDTDEEAVKQKTKSGCGEASLAFVSKASNDREAPPVLERWWAFAQVKLGTLVSNLLKRGGKVNLGDGATAKEMGTVLGELGVKVTGGYQDCDAEAISAALKRGELGLALVDSNAILNATLPEHAQRQEPGQLHWVVIDGYNSGENKTDASDDMYRVKDPVHGEYWVTAKDLQNAIEQGHEAHGGGGVLTVEQQHGMKTLKQRDSLMAQNRRSTQGFSNAGGHGSRRLSVAESS